MASSGKPPRNFRAYGTMEAANVVLIPALALYLGWPGEAAEAVAIVLAILATAGFLVVGAIYWWSMNQRLAGDRRLLQRWLVLADRAERPLLVCLGMAALASGVALALDGWTAAVIAALALTTLAALEYINYYHRQLQHFDNWADFKRLIRSRRLRPAHSARDLTAYRKSAR